MVPAVRAARTGFVGPDADPLTAWSSFARRRPRHGPFAAAVESWRDPAGLSVALAWALPVGVFVSVESVASLAEAASIVSRARVRQVALGMSLWRAPGSRQHLPGALLLPRRSTSTHAVDALRGLLGRGLVLHDGGRAVGDQLDVVLAGEQPENRSAQERFPPRCDGIKAAVWAIRAAIDLQRERPAIY